MENGLLWPVRGPAGRRVPGSLSSPRATAVVDRSEERYDPRSDAPGASESPREHQEVTVLDEKGANLIRLSRRARRADRRLRLDEAIGRGTQWLVFPLLYGVVTLTIIKVARPGPLVERALILGGVVPLFVVVAIVAHSLFRRRSPWAGSLALDRHHRLHDKVTNALAFSLVPPRERTALMEAAIEDGLALSRDLEARRAAPIHFPRDLPLVLVLGAALGGISVLEVRTVRQLPPPAPTFEPLVMSPDDIELFRGASEQLANEAEDPTVNAAVRQFNQLIEDIAEQRLDRREAFRRLEELENALLDAPATGEAAVEEGLEAIARELEKSELSRPIAQKLDEKRAQDAAEAMKKLAERLKNQDEPIDKARLEQLRRSLEKASQTSSKRVEQLEGEQKRLSAERKRLLKKKQQKGLTQEEQRRLERLDRRLERLEREKKRAEGAKKELSQLDRDLADAAKKLMEEMGMSAQDLEKGAQDLNRAARRQMTKQEKEALKRQLEELRQLLRQQGQGGKERLRRLMAFGQRARGGKPGKGKQGQGKQKGQGEGQRPGKPQLRIGPAGPGQANVPVVMPGGGAPVAGRPGSQQSPSGGSQAGGNEHGSGHDPNLKGDKTKLQGQTKDVAAAAADTGQGQSASEVIYGAAERGFVGRGYEKVFVDYQTVAEEVLKTDEVPPGYEFYVRRYFQLIRPRE